MSTPFIHSVLSLGRLFWDICLFRCGPQTVPASQLLLRLVLVVYLLVNAFIVWLRSGWADILIQLPLQLALLMAFVWGLLVFYDKRARYLQTVTAMLGTDILISVCSVPLFLWALYVVDDRFPLLLLLGLMLWQLIVMGHIMRYALSQTWLFGVGLALVYIVLSFQVMAGITSLLA